MKAKSWFFFSVALFPAMFSCKKNSNGLNGDATIVVFLKHNNIIIPNQPGYPDTVFVKFNALTSPGTDPGKYDTFFIGENGKDHVNCRGLKKGLYFFYGVGMDTAGPFRVTGGAAHEIKWSRRNSQQDVNIDVTQ